MKRGSRINAPRVFYGIATAIAACLFVAGTMGFVGAVWTGRTLVSLYAALVTAFAFALMVEGFNRTMSGRW